MEIVEEAKRAVVATVAVVAVEGVLLDRAAGKTAIHMVSAWAHANGVVLGQVN